MSSTVATTEISLTREVEATPEEIYDVWLDKESPGSPWYGVPKVILEKPTVDGLFYTMYEVDGREFAHYGRFLKLDKPRTIEYTWVSEGTQGLESVLTVTLEPKDGKTEVQVHHTNVPDDEEGRKHEHAWGYVLGRMMKYFQSNN